MQTERETWPGSSVGDRQGRRGQGRCIDDSRCLLSGRPAAETFPVPISRDVTSKARVSEPEMPGGLVLLETAGKAKPTRSGWRRSQRLVAGETLKWAGSADGVVLSESCGGVGDSPEPAGLEKAPNSGRSSCQWEEGPVWSAGQSVSVAVLRGGAGTWRAKSQTGSRGTGERCF